MAKEVNLVKVFFQDTLIGNLALGPDRISAFEYDAQWLNTGFSISPFYLPLKAGVFKARSTPFNGLFGVFNDSLPDGWGNLLLDRWLKQQGKDPFSLSVLDRLAYVGGNSMGALTYQPDHSPGCDPGTHPLDYYASQVEKILRDEDIDALDEMLIAAASSAGARPKVVVNIDGLEWLVKFRAMVDPPNIGQIEYEHSLLARKCGIEMPETRLFGNTYFGTRLFDREDGKRIHVHSAAGLLYASHRLPSLDYIALMEATFALTRNIEDVEKLFRLMVFNVLIGNKDDHARNFSFLYRDGKWLLSPAYDILPSKGFGGQHTTTVNGQGNPTTTDCLEVARKTALPLQKAREIIEEVENHL